MTLGSGAVAFAQDASPAASPTGTCNAPALPPGTPTPPQPSPAASPMAMPGTAATPAAAPPVGTPAEGSTVDEVTAGVNNIVNCLNSGNVEGAVALMTSNFLMQAFGTTNPYDVLANNLLQGASFGEIQVNNVQTYADGSVSAEVSYMQSQYQLTTERWTLVQEDNYWKAEHLDVLNPAPEGDTTVVGVTMGGEKGEYTFEPNVTEIPESPVLVFHGVNAGEMVHEIVIVKLPEGTTPDDLIKGDDAKISQLEQQSEFIGQRTYLPGEQGDIALINLPPGVYTLLCAITAPDGQPHFRHGMVTQITVTSTAPVASPVASPAA
jgi:uncharacterized cupredoxin-like copper-binding protein